MAWLRHDRRSESCPPTSHFDLDSVDALFQTFVDIYGGKIATEQHEPSLKSKQMVLLPTLAVSCEGDRTMPE